MLGGYQILDLTNINLELGADAVDITDSDVLKQLLNLREYIEKGYDFSRPLNNQLKPFQVRYRDKKEDEEITATLWASLLVIDSGFIITASIPNYANLEIYVAFDEATDDDGNNYWVIDTAQVKYNLIASSGTKLYKHNFSVSGDELVFLSLRKEPYIKEEYDDIGFILGDINTFGGSYYNDSDTFTSRVLAIDYDEDEDSLRITAMDETRTASNNTYLIDFTAFIDTVTEL